jgi:glycosyltransferase involved in cell wall biosynthesis
MTTLEQLSVCIITRNEARNIGACLESVAWADEVVVLDSGSHDETEAICREFGVRFHTATDWKGFGVQKNRALALTTGHWVLVLDADERVSDALRAEIVAAIADPDSSDVLEMPRLSHYCGRPMRHSGWWPDYVPRLFRRGHARFSDDLVHERLLFDGNSSRLVQPLIHFSYRDLGEVLQRIDAYSTAGAENLSDRKRGSLSCAISHGLWTFLKTYLFRLGFLDGREGFMLAVSNAEGVYYRYLKLYYLQLKTKESR